MAGRVGSLAGSAIKGIGIAAGAAAIGGIAALTIGLKKAIENAAEGQRIMAETGRVIESMGAGAWTSSEQIAELSSRLGRVSAAGDEAVQEVANLVLTFGDIRNEGEGVNAIFDRTVELSLDLARVMKTDNKSAAIQLAKALQDPVRGLTALRKSGVSFTERQKEQIKTLVASGKTLEAQKIILGELEKQVGGASEAYGKTFLGAIDRVKNAIGDMSELVGGPLIDALGAPATSGFADWLERVHDILEPLSQRLTDMFTRLDLGGKIAAKLQPALDVTERLLRELVGRFEKVAPEIEAAIGRGDWPAVSATLARLWEESLDAVAPDLSKLFKVDETNWEAAKVRLGSKLVDVLEGAMDSALAASGRLAAKLGEVIGRVLGSGEFWTALARGFGAALQGAWDAAVASSTGQLAVSLGVGLVAAVALALGGAPFAAIAVGLAAVLPAVGEISKRIGLTIRQGITAAGKAIISFAADIGERLFSGAIRAGEMVGRGLRLLPGEIGRALSGIGTWLVEAGRDLVRGLWNGIKSMGRWLYTQIRNWVVSNVPGPIADILGIRSPSKVAAELGRSIPEGFAQGIRDKIGLVQRMVGLMVRAAQIGRVGIPAPVMAGAPTVPGRLGPPVTTGLRSRPVNQNINITFAGPVAGQDQLRAMVQQALREFQRRNGMLGF